MPRVKVKTLGILYTQSGRLERVVEVPEGATVMDVLKIVAVREESIAGELFKKDLEELNEENRVLLNGREIAYLPDKEKTRVSDGDEIVVIPPVGGGLLPGLA